MVAHSSIDHTGVIGVPATLSFGSNSNSVAIANQPGASPSNSRADHVHLGVTSISHTSNTYSGPITLTTPGNTVGITSPGTGQLAFTASGGSGGGGGSVTASMNQLGANVTMTTAGTFYDGPSLSLAAGTYILMGTICVDGTSLAVSITAKLWNGTTVLSSAECLTYGGSTTRENSSLTLVGYVVLSGTETWKISVTASGGAAVLLAAAQLNGAGNNASTLVALKIA